MSDETNTKTENRIEANKKMVYALYEIYTNDDDEGHIYNLLNIYSSVDGAKKYAEEHYSEIFFKYPIIYKSVQLNIICGTRMGKSDDIYDFNHFCNYLIEEMELKE